MDQIKGTYACFLIVYKHTLHFFRWLFLAAKDMNLIRLQRMFRAHKLREKRVAHGIAGTLSSDACSVLELCHFYGTGSRVVDRLGHEVICHESTGQNH